MSRTLLLARTFFARFFESDLMPPGLPQAQLVIWSLALLASPGLMMPFRLANQYSALTGHPDLLARALHTHRLLFLTITMVSIGLVALVTWQNVFPDRRDARLLGVLPLGNRLLAAARLLALSMLAGVFLVGINAVPTLVYGPLSAYYGGAPVLLGPIAHAVASICAGAFVFFALIAVMGLWMNIGVRVIDRFGFALQVVALFAVLLQVAFLARMMARLGTDLSGIAADSRASLVPAFWFLGLYDVVGGNPGPGSAALAARAVVATVAVVTLAIATLALTHGRLMKLALEGHVAPRRGRRPRSLLDAIARVVCRGPVERAIFPFTIRTLMRSRSHRLLLALYLGLALALIAVTVGPLAARFGYAAFREPSVPVLAAPLVLLFFLLTGTNVMMAIPVEPKANWVFRLLEPANRVAALGGVRHALLVAIVAPIAIVAGAGAAVWWGAWTGFVHALVCMLMGWALCEFLVLRSRKLPFTCTYFPGRSRARLWPFYLLATSNYAFPPAAIVLATLHRPRALAIFLGALVLVSLGLAALRARLLAAPPGLRFEEEDPEALFAGFRLSEALAARSTPAGEPERVG